MKQLFITQKVLGIMFILLGIVPFAVLPTTAFTGYGLFTIYLRTTFIDLLQGNSPTSVWSVVGYLYWTFLFTSAVLVTFGIVLCIAKSNTMFKKAHVGLPVVVATGAFYTLTFVVNIIMISRNFATVSFYIYTLSKIFVITTLILTFVIAQKSNDNQKKEIKNESN